MCFSGSQTCSYTKWELVWMTSCSMLMGLSVIDVSEESKFLFITASIKAFSLLQRSDGKLFSQTTSCHLQLSIVFLRFRQGQKMEHNSAATTYQLWVHGQDVLPYCHLYKCLVNREFAHEDHLVFFPRVWKWRKDSFLWTVQIVSIYRKF